MGLSSNSSCTKVCFWITVGMYYCCCTRYCGAPSVRDLGNGKCSCTVLGVACAACSVRSLRLTLTMEPLSRRYGMSRYLRLLVSATDKVRVHMQYICIANLPPAPIYLKIGFQDEQQSFGTAPFAASM